MDWRSVNALMMHGNWQEFRRFVCVRAVRDFLSLLIQEQLREEARKENEWDKGKGEKSEKVEKKEK